MSGGGGAGRGSRGSGCGLGLGRERVGHGRTGHAGGTVFANEWDRKSIGDKGQQGRGP